MTFSQWQCFDYDSIDNNDDGGLDAKPDASITCGNAEVIVQCLIYFSDMKYTLLVVLV